MGTGRAHAIDMRRILVSLSCLAFVGAAACGGSVSSVEIDAGDQGHQSHPDVDGGVPDSMAGRCIAPSSAPACCMTFGGWSATGQDTTTECDNLPDPGAPGWTQALDAHGCWYWSPPPNAAIGCNGKPPPPKPDAGVTCCPISDAPNCCMNYGGSERLTSCGMTCDGMPGPGYPGWQKRIDEDGCPFWFAPPDAPHECGAIVVDGGPTEPPPPWPDDAGTSSADASSH